MTGPRRGLVTSEAGDLHRELARRAGDGCYSPLRPPGLPGTHWPVLILNLQLDILMTSRLTAVTTREAFMTSEFTGGTRPGVATVTIVGARVMTIARDLTLLLASRGLHGSFPSAGNAHRGGATVAADLLIQVTGITTPGVTP